MSEIQDKLKNILAAADLLEIDGYKYIKPLAGGKMGAAAVFEDDDSERAVFKFLIAPRNDFELLNFEIEAYAAAAAKRMDELSPNIVKGLVPFNKAGSHISRHENFPIFYFGQEFAEGLPLSEYIPPKAYLNSDERLKVVLEISAGLAHSRMMLIKSHGDLHAGNVLYDKDKEQVRILDFGVAKCWEIVHGRESEIGFSFNISPERFRHSGAVGCWSPEHLKDPGELSETHDSWALGILLHRLIDGSWPFSSECFGEYYENILNSQYDPPISSTSFEEELLSTLFRKNQYERASPNDVVVMTRDHYNNGISHFTPKERREYFLVNGNYVEHGCGYRGRPFGKCPRCGTLDTPDQHAWDYKSTWIKRSAEYSG